MNNEQVGDSVAVCKSVNHSRRSHLDVKGVVRHFAQIRSSDFSCREIGEGIDIPLTILYAKYASE